MKKSASGDRQRMTVELPCAVEQKLKAMADARGVTKADLIRAAVQMIAEFDVLQSDGYSVGGWKVADDGARETVRFLVAV